METKEAHTTLESQTSTIPKKCQFTRASMLWWRRASAAAAQVLSRDLNALVRFPFFSSRPSHNTLIIHTERVCAIFTSICLLNLAHTAAAGYLSHFCTAPREVCVLIRQRAESRAAVNSNWLSSCAGALGSRLAAQNYTPQTGCAGRRAEFDWNIN